MNKNIVSNVSSKKSFFISPDQVLKLKTKQIKVKTTEKQPSNLLQSPYLSKNPSFSLKKDSFLSKRSNLDTPNYKIRIKKKSNNQNKNLLTQQSSITNIDTESSINNT